MKLLLASLIALTPVSASADDVIQWETTSKTCYRETYTEEYIPGTKNDPGYVRTYTELIEYPCKDDVATDRVLKRELWLSMMIMIVLMVKLLVQY